MNTKIIPTFKKIWQLLLNIFGTKTKKSFASVINHLTETYENEGLISSEEKKLFRNMVGFADKQINSIMTNRSDIIAIKQNASLEEIKNIINEDQHTRIPIYADTFDNIVGFIHSKDLAKFLSKKNDELFEINKIMRKILFFPCTMKLLDVLLLMRMARVHIGIVLDEFGGVDGLVTIENIVEEIVGQIEDEHDLPLESVFFQIKKITDRLFHIGGRVSLAKFSELVGITIEDENHDTVAGMVISAFNRLPEINEEIERFGIIFKVVAIDNRTLKTIAVQINQ
jgi:CBS domain containing-hemolysin-like protein